MARDLWITAAGRIAQHHALWPVPEGHVLGSRPPVMGHDDYAFTHYAVQRAVADLDRALTRVLTRAAPGLSL